MKNNLAFNEAFDTDIDLTKEQLEFVNEFIDYIKWTDIERDLNYYFWNSWVHDFVKRYIAISWIPESFESIRSDLKKIISKLPWFAIESRTFLTLWVMQVVNNPSRFSDPNL